MNAIAPQGLPISRDWRGEVRMLSSLAGPLVVAQLAQMAMGVVGTLVAGRLGVRMLAAQALGATVFVFAIITAFGLMAGADPHVARAMGAGDFDRAGRLFRQGLWLAVATALLFTVALWAAPWLLLAMGQEAALIADTRAYLDIAALGMAPAMVYAMGRSFASATGKAGAVMVVAVVGNVVHAVLAFVWALAPAEDPADGLRRLAWATVICRFGMTAGLLAWIELAPGFRYVRARWHRPHLGEMLPILRSGLPLALQYGLEVTGFVLTTLWMGLLGADTLAAHEVALSTAAIAFQIPFSLGTAAAMRTGHAVGRGDAGGIRRAGWVAFGIGTAYAVVSGIAMLFGRDWIAHAYLPDAPMAVLTLAAHFLAIGAAFQLADGIQAIGFGVLRGLDDTRLPVVFNVLGFALLGMPLGYVGVFVLGQHADRLWWGLSLALGVVAVALVVRFAWWCRNVGRVRGFVAQTEPLDPAAIPTVAG